MMSLGLSREINGRVRCFGTCEIDGRGVCVPRRGADLE